MILLINTITVHRTIKMKPIDVRSDSYAEYNEDFNKKYTKFKVGDHVRENTVPWTYVVSDLNCKEITGSFYEK